MKPWMLVGLFGASLVGLGSRLPPRPRLWGPGLLILALATVLKGRADGSGVAALCGAEPGAVGALVGVALHVLWITVREAWLQCPRCPTGRLKRETRVLSPSTPYATGRVRKIADCPGCGWHEEKEETTARRNLPGRGY